MGGDRQGRQRLAQRGTQCRGATKTTDPGGGQEGMLYIQRPQLLSVILPEQIDAQWGGRAGPNWRAEAGSQSAT